MNIAGKKNTIKKEVRRTRKLKPMKEIRNIGLKEKNEEAERVLRSLKNPELLK